MLPPRWFVVDGKIAERGERYEAPPPGKPRLGGFTLQEVSVHLRASKRTVRTLCEAMGLELGQRHDTRILTAQEATRVVAEFYRRRGALKQRRAARARRRLARGRASQSAASESEDDSR